MGDVASPDSHSDIEKVWLVRHQRIFAPMAWGGRYQITKGTNWLVMAVATMSMYSQVLMVPEEQLGVVVLTNSMTSIAPCWHIARLMYFLAVRKKITAKRTYDSIGTCAENSSSVLKE